MKDLIIVGLDFSIDETGIAATGTNQKPAGMCVVRSGKVHGKTDTERFADHATNILRVIQAQSTTPQKTLILMEDYAFSAKGQITRIAEACGTLKHLLYTNGFPPDQILLVSPSMLKKFTTGKGNAQKDLMLLMAFKRWGINSTNNNEVDAYALQMMGIGLLKDYSKQPKYEQETFAKLIATNKKELGAMTWLSHPSNVSLPQDLKPKKKKSSRNENSPSAGYFDMETEKMEGKTSTPTPTRKLPLPTSGILLRRKL